MKIAFLCSDDISNKLFIQTLKKYNFEISVFVENNDSNKKKLIKSRSNIPNRIVDLNDFNLKTNTYE